MGLRSYKQTRGNVEGVRDYADLVTENIGRSPTYQSGESSSVIDYTFSRRIAPNSIDGLKVDEDCFSNSDHNYIYYEVKNMTTEAPQPRTTARSWAIRRINTVKLEEYIDRATHNRSVDWLSDDPNTAAAQFCQYIEKRCNLSKPSRGYPGAHGPAYWWTDSIVALRRECIHTRRLYQRAERRARADRP